MRSPAHGITWCDCRSGIDRHRQTA